MNEIEKKILQLAIPHSEDVRKELESIRTKARGLENDGGFSRFVLTFIKRNRKKSTPFDTIYKKYIQWTDRRNIAPLPKTHFYRKFEHDLKTEIEFKNGKLEAMGFVLDDDPIDYVETKSIVVTKSKSIEGDYPLGRCYLCGNKKHITFKINDNQNCCSDCYIELNKRLGDMVELND